MRRFGRLSGATAVVGSSRRRRLLLSGTALSLGALFSMAEPQGALAACTIVVGEPTQVICDADTTTDNTLNTDTSRNQVYPHNIEGQVDPGVTVDAYGLRLETTIANGGIEMDHQGTVILEAGNDDANTGAPLFGPGALELNGNGGVITYSGNGVVVNETDTGAGVLITNSGFGAVQFGTAATPIVPDYTGPTALRIVTQSGDQNIFLDGGSLTTTADGAFALAPVSLGAGDINISLTGNTAIQTTAGTPVRGVFAASGGDVTITSDANIGTAVDRARTGLAANAQGSVNVTQTGGSIFVGGGGGVGIEVEGNSNTTVVMQNGAIIDGVDGFGIRARSDATTMVTLDAGSKISMAGGTGILARSLGASGSVVVTVNGDIDPPDVGVDASIIDPLNPDNVIVHQNTDLPANVTGIIASHAGTGNILVDGAGDVVAGTDGIVATQTNNAAGTFGHVTIAGSGDTEGTDDIGIDAQITGANNSGNVTVNRSGAVTGATAGINAATAGNGLVIVTVSDDVTATDGNAIQTSAVDGLNSVDLAGGTVAATGDGVNAVSEGTGGIMVDMSGGQIGTAATPVGGNGILARSTAAASDGDIDVNATTIHAQGRGVQAEILNPANPGNITVDVADGGTVEGGVTAETVGTGNAVVTIGDDAVVNGNSPGSESITAGGNAIQIIGSGATVTGSSGVVVDQTGAGGAGMASVQVGNNSTIEGNGGDPADPYNGNGIFAGNRGTGLTSVVTGDGTQVTGAANGIVTSAEDGDTTITALGLVMAGERGIDAETSGGDIAILAPQIGTAIDPVGSDGIRAVSTGVGDSDIDVTADMIFAGEHGVHAAVVNGLNSGDVSVSVMEDGVVESGGAGFSSVLATTAGTGDVSVTLANGATLEGGVWAQSGAGSASVVGGNDVSITGNSPGSASFTAGGDATQQFGNNANVSGSSGIVVDQTNPAGAGDAIVQVGTVGTIIGDGTDPADPYNGNGIFARNQGTGETSVMIGAGTSVTGDTNGIQTLAAGGGNTVIAAMGEVDGGVDGIHAVAAGAGDITIDTHAAVEGANGDGIVTSAIDGDTAIRALGTVDGNDDGIEATATGDGAIAVITDAAVTGGDDGIVTSAASGNTTIIALGTVDGNDGGIDATATGDGAIEITTHAAVTGGDDGIATSTVNGSTTINANADVTGDQGGIDASSSASGNVVVNVADGTTVRGLDAANGAGIAIDTDTGTGTVNNSGLIEGAMAAISGAAGSVVQVVNSAVGTIQNLGGAPDEVAIQTDGPTTIINDGLIVGRVNTGAGNDTFINRGNTWHTSGTSDFGDENDEIRNEGRIVVAHDPTLSEDTVLANLESFVNTPTGIIDMVEGDLGDPGAGNDPGTRDTFTMPGGTYTGQAGSRIEMDVALTIGRDPVANSDLVTFDNANTATGTSDLLFNIVSTGETATTQNTDRVTFANGQILASPVTVVENRGDLTTSSGDDAIPLARSGLVVYDLVSAGDDFQIVSQLDEGLAGGLLLPIPATLAAVALTSQKSPTPITAGCIDPAARSTAQAGWVRGHGGEFRTQTEGTQTTGGRRGDQLASDNETRFFTMQGGFDTVFCDFDGIGGNLHLGVTVGNTWGESIQRNVDPARGIFGTNVEFDSFFVGPYAAYSRNGFALLASLRFDDHELELANEDLIDDELKVDGDGVSAGASASYDINISEMPLAPQYQFILTPEVGLNISRTRIDDFDVGGGSVELEDLWSALGHFGLTGRTTIAADDDLFVTPFAAATVYREFITDAESQFVLGGETVDAVSDRVGTYGQVGVGLNAIQVGDVAAGQPTYFGGARLDMQFGERLQGFTASLYGRIQF